MEYPFVSVVVGIRNEEKFIEECIESLLHFDYPQESYEVIIVDGMSTDKPGISYRNTLSSSFLITEKMLRQQGTLEWKKPGEILLLLWTGNLVSIPCN